MASPTKTRRRPLWPILWLIPAAAFLALLGFAALRSGTLPSPGDRAPGFSAPNLDGNGSVSLRELEGKPVLVNFWASWCVPCRDEAPLLADAHEAYSNEVTFLGVVARDSRIDAARFEGDFDIEYPSVFDGGREIYDEYGLSGQPESFLIDAEGIIVEHITGPFRSREQIFGLLDVLVRRDG